MKKLSKNTSSSSPSAATNTSALNSLVAEIYALGWKDSKDAHIEFFTHAETKTKQGLEPKKFSKYYKKVINKFAERSLTKVRMEIINNKLMLK